MKFDAVNLILFGLVAIPGISHGLGYYGPNAKCEQNMHMLTVVVNSEPDVNIGSVINEVPVKSLEECARVCVNDSIKCTSFHFLRDNSNNIPLCRLLMANHNSGQISINEPIKSHIIYSGRILCLPTKIGKCERPWSFEKIEGLSVVGSQFVISTLVQTTEESCLSACVEEARCESVQRQENSGACRLLEVSPNSVRDVNEYFRNNNEWTLYENNCNFVSMSPKTCQFIRRIRTGMLSLFDIVMENVQSATTCKSLCMQYHAATCRSYTYDTRSSMCYLSHSTMRNLLKIRTSEFIEERNSKLRIREDYLEMGELDDCIHLELKCQQEGMIVKANAMKMYSGKFTAKNQPACATNIENQYNFQATISYTGCGTRKTDDTTFVNVIMLKDGSTQLITIRDKLVQLICRIYMPDISVSFDFHVNPNPDRNYPNDPLIIRPDELNESKRRPKFKLDIYDHKLRPAKIVANGEKGFIEIILQNNEDSISDVQVTDLVATDLNSNHKIVLFDENGCPTDKSYEGVLKNVGNGIFRAPITFFGFADSAQIYYSGLAKPCKSKCYSNCEVANDLIRRRRSNANKKDENASNLLTDERYAIVTQNTLQFIEERRKIIMPVNKTKTLATSVVGDKRSTIPKNYLSVAEVEEFGITESDPNIHIQRVISHQVTNTVFCFAEDPNCYVTILLAFLQALLLILFGFILYVYCRNSPPPFVSHYVMNFRDNYEICKEYITETSISIYTRIHLVHKKEDKDIERNTDKYIANIVQNCSENKNFNRDDIVSDEGNRVVDKSDVTDSVD